MSRTVLVTGAAGFIGSRRRHSRMLRILSARDGGSLSLQGLRPRTPVLADASVGDGDHS